MFYFFRISSLPKESETGKLKLRDALHFIFLHFTKHQHEIISCRVIINVLVIPVAGKERKAQILQYDSRSSFSQGHVSEFQRFIPRETRKARQPVRAIVNRITIKWPSSPRYPFEHTSGERHPRTIVLRQRNELLPRFTVASFMPRETAPKIAMRVARCSRDEWQYRGRILWSAIKASASAVCRASDKFHLLGGSFLSSYAVIFQGTLYPRILLRTVRVCVWWYNNAGKALELPWDRILISLHVRVDFRKAVHESNQLHVICRR
jgi:hypothetical protein